MTYYELDEWMADYGLQVMAKSQIAFLLGQLETGERI